MTINGSDEVVLKREEYAEILIALYLCKKALTKLPASPYDDWSGVRDAIAALEKLETRT